MTCAVCGGHRGVSDMTDGRGTISICDGCRELVRMLFMVHGSLATAVKEAKQAKTGKKE